MPELSPAGKRRRFVVAIGFTVVILLVVLPGKYEAAPAWTVTVVDSKKQPIQGAEIEQTYSYWFGAHRVEKSANKNLSTDVKGRVVLPPRIIRTPRIAAWTGSMFGLLSVHSSYGPNSTVYASKSGFERNGVWRNPKIESTNGMLYSELVLHPTQP